MKSDREIKEMFDNNIKLVWYVLNKDYNIFFNRGDNIIEDLYQEGCIGLYKAVLKFDESKGFAFSSYAFIKIKGEIGRYLRDKRWIIKVPRKWFKKDELIESDKVHLENITNLTSLNTDVVGKGGNVKAFSNFVEDSVTSKDIEDLEMRLTLIESLNVLTDKEKYCIINNIIHERSQSDIAKEIGTNQVMVSRLIRRGLAKLKESMKTA